MSRRERWGRAVMAAAFWLMLGWCAHALVTQWVDDLGADEDDSPQVVEVMR
ncbi:MAG: hypothetical protein ABSH01_19070 [Terriglobia bacterium]